MQVCKLADMDQTLQQIARYASNFTFSNLSSDVILDGRKRLIDVVACAVAAYDKKPSAIARQMAMQHAALPQAQLIGTHHFSSVEMAAFANGVMIRYLDGADTYPGGGGHGSDCWAGILAVAQFKKSTFQEIITAITLAYEVFYRLFQAGNFREHGLDNVLYVTVGTAVGVCHLLKLNEQQIAHAVSMALTGHLPMGVARTGVLSMWKSGASGNAARNGVFCAMLAQLDFDAPAQPFEGVRGLFEITKKFTWPLLPSKPTDIYALSMSHMKSYLCDYHSQTPILAAMQLHQQCRVEDIAHVHIQTYWFAWNEVASEKEKWHPSNRETADHSMPWIVAGVLTDGVFSEQIFEAHRLVDTNLHAMAEKITIDVNDALTKQFPDRMPCIMTITTNQGEKFEMKVDMPHGHYLHPLQASDIKNKFKMLTRQHYKTEQADRILSMIWQMDLNEPIDQIFKEVVIL